MLVHNGYLQGVMRTIDGLAIRGRSATEESRRGKPNEPVEVLAMNCTSFLVCFQASAKRLSVNFNNVLQYFFGILLPFLTPRTTWCLIIGYRVLRFNLILVQQPTIHIYGNFVPIVNLVIYIPIFINWKKVMIQSDIGVESKILFLFFDRFYSDEIIEW